MNGLWAIASSPPLRRSRFSLGSARWWQGALPARSWPKRDLIRSSSITLPNHLHGSHFSRTSRMPGNNRKLSWHFCSTESYWVTSTRRSAAVPGSPDRASPNSVKLWLFARGGRFRRHQALPPARGAASTPGPAAQFPGGRGPRAKGIPARLHRGIRPSRGAFPHRPPGRLFGSVRRRGERRCSQQSVKGDPYRKAVGRHVSEGALRVPTGGARGAPRPHRAAVRSGAPN